METIKTTLAQNLGGIAHNLGPASGKFELTEVPKLTGKVAVVTGGSEGIGYGCTHTLLSNDISKLFIISMSEDIADKAVEAIAEEMGDSVAKRVRWLKCDLSDWKKAEETAETISKETDRLDILINNAARGIMTYQLAPTNGVDLHMAGNHFGHVVLTSHLLPLLQKTAEKDTVRIVNLGSNAHQNAPKDVKFASLEELNTDYGPVAQYGRTKLASILYSRYLARHLTPKHPNLLANATHPGVVFTRQSEEHIFEPYPLGGYAMKALGPFKKDQFEGCTSTMYAATVTKGSGEYICPPAQVEEGSEQSRDEALGEQLMKLTREIVEKKTRSDSSQQGCPFKDAGT